MNSGADLALELERRRLLRLALAGVAAAALPGGAGSQTSFADYPFGLGVASGSPQADSVVLWTRLHHRSRRLSPPSVIVHWELAHDEQFKRVVQSGSALASAELAHSVHVEVSGLEADRWYFYRFMVGNALSPVGRTRTLPAPNAPVSRLRLAYASCQKWEDGYFSAWRHMRAENLDLVLFLGDYIYEYPAPFARVRRPSGGWVLTLDDYRKRYALYRGEADLQAMHGACPWLVIWDDHEVQNDYAGVHAGNSGPSDPAVGIDFLLRRAAAYQAWYEHMPVRSSVLLQGLAGLAQGAEMRIYDRLHYGQLASLYLLDTRQYRDRQVCNRGDASGSGNVDPDQCSQWQDTQRTLLGQRQEAWLDQAFASARPANWNVLGQQTLFGQRDLRPGVRRSFWNDGWDGYSAARQRLLGSMQQHRLANAVILGGDVHTNWVGHVKADYNDPRSANLGVEFCGTSITSRASGNGNLEALLAGNPHFIFAEATKKGYGVAEFTPKQLGVKLRVVDDVTRQDSQIETLASFAVTAGRAQVQRV